MNKQTRMIIKSILIAFCLILLIIIGYDKGKEWIVLQPEGAYARVQDVMILSCALQEDFDRSDSYRNLSGRYLTDADAAVTYGEYLGILEEIGTQQTPRFAAQYKEEHYLLQADWDRAFNEMRGFYDTQGDIRDITVTPAGLEDRVSDREGSALGPYRLLTDEGEVFSFESDTFRRYNYQTIDALCKGDTLLTVTGIRDQDQVLANVFLLAAEDSELVYFYQNYEVRAVMEPFVSEVGDLQEQMADLHFTQGNLSGIGIKKEKISGKLLAVSDTAITLEGHGTIPFTPDMQSYRLYDSLKTCLPGELAIGYDFTDFVTENGKICGALVTGKEAMEYIRVAIKTADFASLIHTEASVSSDVDYTVTYGSYDQRQSRRYRAGEVYDLDPESADLKEGNVIITPDVHTGRLSLLSLKRSQGIPEYRGTIEISPLDEGLAVVNEVLLEEYLYSVVPSEMPSSYPLEALKAQAVCARTYAYRYLLRSGLGQLGAHVDDSVNYQVYNNIAENSSTTKAVKETTGAMLYYDGEPAGTYYYSTSCGYGTTAAVWKSGNPEDTVYIQASVIGGAAENPPDDMRSEEKFAAFIQGERESDYEREEPWYRWEVYVRELHKDTIRQNLQNRYEANPNLVLTLDGDAYISKTVKKVGDITDIYCVKRLPGGVMDELIIETTEATFKVVSENAIRYVLSDGVSKVVRQDGSEVNASALLPSAFMIVAPVREKGEDIMTGYRIYGGGYGHGVGMSQNGAKALGEGGAAFDQILDCFYGSCDIRMAY